MHHQFSRSATGPLLMLAALVAGCSDGETTIRPVPKSAGGEAGDTAGIGGSDAAGAGGSAGTGGVAGTPIAAAGSAGTPNVTRLLIDDFEDGDTTPLIGGGWYLFTDIDNGGGSTLTVPNATGAAGSTLQVTGEGYQSKLSLSVAYTFDRGTLTYDPYVGFGVWFADSTAPFDFSGYSSLSYSYRGGAHSVRVETYSVKDYDYFRVAVPASTNWTTVNLPFSSFSQEGWGVAAKLDLTNVGNVSFQMRGATGQTGQLQIDDLMVVGGETVRVADMPVNAPAPPADVVVDPLAIPNPLQAKAMQYLDRGYNITNWLEQDRFSGFTYDETFVRELAAAGFRSLRLPIDLDRYVESTTGTGDALTITLHDDLFTILDAFNAWTKKYALSLTVDYHQYDGSISMSDADSLTKAVQLWGKVAEHFAGEQREDLFFELLNEPELSFSGTPPTKAQWTALAERMVTSVRAQDTTHSILFGDVQWYGIDELVTRTPLADTNVIYVVHDYDPFIFTHQGANWANLATAHDVPYPYTAERWSQYSADLGFNSTMPSWILSAARDYYAAGNRSALRNHIAAAKRWAVTHNVPVICNEFGAYDRISRLEDRVRYYTDIVDIFEELQIPWQHWFMVMDTDGNVVPVEYRAAFGLDG
jgi:endoglucanase